ncbi:hypothetical protein PG2048B_1133 [Bifidobacterium pseudolongum subsp. globosum]|uniref:hypothetical protein n=1 Tax=Bifidobacterium pseudolongum TaxID=1694 RepID=UPI001020D0AC|nr:hypothetical protein [Bifidobacterium pseudolongum]RYQ24831.1 hypothetical protein PG2048B_1133 [Bifidobacterium pseudolongum subsp. globosum]
MITRSVTVAKIKREYWQMIKDERKRYEIRSNAVAYDSQVFVFVDADSQEYLGCARIKGETLFGGYDNSPWTWNLLSQLSAVPVDELQELFSWMLGITDAESEVELSVYEVEPIDEATLTAYIIHGPNAFEDKNAEAGEA